MLKSLALAAISTHAPAGGATFNEHGLKLLPLNFYSRPCGRGDALIEQLAAKLKTISTHAPAGGATFCSIRASRSSLAFLLTPLREGRPFNAADRFCPGSYFYSRPCGRGDAPFTR